MKPTAYELKLYSLVSDVQTILLNGLDIRKPGYTAEVRKRVLEAERAFEALRLELKQGEK